MNISEQIENLLHQSGLKSTPVRRSILKMLFESRQPVSCEEIFSAVIDDSGENRHNLVTVYRNINTFSEKGLVTRTDLGGERACYELKVGQKHRHHVVCTECHRVIPLEMCGLDHHVKAVKQLGFTQVQHRLEFYGLCKKCS